jgi:hypothetical protein
VKDTTMTPETSAATIAVRVPATAYARLPSVGAPTAGDAARVPAHDGVITTVRTGLPRGVRRVMSALGDTAWLLAVAYALPLVILAIGIPIALLVRLFIWTVRAL